MTSLLILPIAAAGWSLLYMLLGGGFVGAIVIFIVLKMFRR
jgi:hypothetical protein